MRNNKLILIFSSLFIVLLVGLVIIYFCYIRKYNDRYFEISYNVDWKKYKSNNFAIKNRNDSTIEIYVQIDKDSTETNDIYLDLNNAFLEKNSDYKLINSSEVKIGKNYYDGYELLYETEKKQLLYIIVVKDNKIFNISYSSSNDNFDLDLDYFYEVINSMEIG